MQSIYKLLALLLIRLHFLSILRLQHMPNKLDLQSKYQSCHYLSLMRYQSLYFHLLRVWLFSMRLFLCRKRNQQDRAYTHLRIKIRPTHNS